MAVRVSLQGINVNQYNVLKSHENTTLCVCGFVCCKVQVPYLVATHIAWLWLSQQ